MNFKFWIENKITFNVQTLLKLINMAPYKKQLGGGNCGQFALGLSRFIKDTYKLNNIFIALICDNNYNQIEDLLFTEPDIYHVFIQYHNQFFDETGLIDINYLLKLAYDQYQDIDPIMFSELNVYDEKVRKIINYNTNFTIEWTYFYNYYNKLNFNQDLN